MAFFATVSSARADEPTTPPSQPAPDGSKPVDAKSPDAKTPDAKAHDPNAPDAPGDTKKPDGADKPDATSNGAKTGDAEAKPSEPPKVPLPPAAPHHEHQGTFQFGSYGRVVAAVDGFGGPGRDANIVANGSRLDEDNYVEVELRREDIWEKTGAVTRAVITLAIASPIFHWDADFSINMAVRNLYLEEQDLGLKGLSVWAGSRMLRGDDIYVLDWWPLDNLNTLGAGVGYERLIDWGHLATMLHVGVARPNAPFYYQQVERPAPLDQFGTVSVDLLNRVRVIGSFRAEWNQRLTNPDKGPGPGLKAVAYGELHTLAKGVDETTGNVLQTLPADSGLVVGAELMAYTGLRDTYVNAFVRYATGIAAYGQWASPGGLNAQKTTERSARSRRRARRELPGIRPGGHHARELTSARCRAGSADARLRRRRRGRSVLARPAVFFGEIAGFVARRELPARAAQECSSRTPPIRQRRLPGRSSRALAGSA